MFEPITVTYEDGVLKPTQPLPFEEHETLAVQVVPQWGNGTSSNGESVLMKLRESLNREKEAYNRLHPLLKEKYFGKNVAIYKGELVDVDEDYISLYRRIREKYPDDVLWLSPVKEEPIGTVHPRSPRISSQNNEIPNAKSDGVQTESFDESESEKKQSEAISREQKAYIELHPMLKETYLGQSVAIYQGELIDVDEDFSTLVGRVRKKYPQEVVLMKTVKEEPIETIYMRSIRFAK
ncbi:MAG: DUF5678 domain-containing protein [Chloroflexota bacterium]